MEGIEDEDKKDGRANNGALKGISRGQGRPPKAREKKLSNYALGAMKRVFGSEEKAWLELAKQSKDSFPHMRLLWEYKYGKPKELKELSVKTEINIPIINFGDKDNIIDIESEEIKDDDKKESS
jgi:hypothetical protein|tara:strand:+ start:1249 stop:1620 length:372 start_codon:yes stop_codon:yes gene_type:complete